MTADVPRYIKHTIECVCVLPQNVAGPEPKHHSFPVFSLLDDDGEVVEKHVACNFCGVVHRVYEVGKSEVKPGYDNTAFVVTARDVLASLPQNLAGLLDEYALDVATLEHVAYVVDNDLEDVVILTREVDTEHVSGKRLIIRRGGRFSVETFRERLVVD